MAQQTLAKTRTYWVAKDGTRIRIDLMPTSHLLNTIHYIERVRMQQLVSLKENRDELQEAIRVTEEADLIDYYAQWPEGYTDLVREAEKRTLIQRCQT